MEKGTTDMPSVVGVPREFKDEERWGGGVAGLITREMLRTMRPGSGVVDA
jgi:hypothetical protein